jgi:hypothetical protein
MGKTLAAIAEQLRDANKKVQLIYAFNGTGKTRLSRAFKALIAPKAEGEEAQASVLQRRRSSTTAPSRKICSIGRTIWSGMLNPS